jgi:transposase InsO family protein
MHNINNEGSYIDFIFEEQYDEHTVPIIYTEDEDNQIMNEMNEMMFIPTPKQQPGTMKDKMHSDVAPVCIVKIHYISGIRLDRPLICLFDTGSTGTMIQQRCLPPGAKPNISNQKRITTTINGSFDTSLSVQLNDISLPEFVNGRIIDGIEARLFDSPSCRYDIIFGRDFLKKTNMKFCFERNIVDWMGASITMKPVDHYNMISEVTDYGLQPQDAIFIEYLNICVDMEENELFNNEEKELLGAAYGKVTTEQVATEQKHLSNEQQQQLKETLDKHKTCFNGELGKVPGFKFKLEIDPNATPFYGRQYPIPYKYQRQYEEELLHMEREGILSRHHTGSQWAAPSFVVPKKDNRIRIVTDFRELNKRILRRPYPLPRIQEVMRKQQGYKYFTKIDLSMCFYCFELDDESKAYTTTFGPDGKLYHYNVLPMGVCTSPFATQATMEKILQGLDVVVYIDDIGIWTKDSFGDHLQKVNEVLQRLSDNNLKTNPLKCSWGVEETDFLGHWMTPTACKPMKKKVDALIQMSPPRNKKQLRSFIGGVNFYNSIWPRRTHVLAPLTRLTGDVPFKWTKECDDAFKEMKAILATDCLNSYADLDKPFTIVCDASDYQLGSCIMQDGKPIAYWSKSLTAAQKNYTTTEKELLAIVLTLKEYRSMLLGGTLNIYTDHKNLTFRTLSIQRVLRWRLYMEEFNYTLHYLEGEKNVLADCFSRLPRMPKISVGDKELNMIKEKKGDQVDFKLLKVPRQTEDEVYLITTTTAGDWNYNNTITTSNKDEPELFPTICNNDDCEVIECLLNLPSFQNTDNPLTMINIANHQQNDPWLAQTVIVDPIHYPIKIINGITIVCYRNQFNIQDNEWKIFIPQTMINQTIRWYHLLLGHPGSTRLYDTITARFHHPGLSTLCQQYQCPDNCTMYKNQGQQYGYLAPRQAYLMPWEAVAVDLIGPWRITINNRELEFKALTIIDPVSNLLEIIRIDNKTSANVSQQFANTWLSRYPWPIEVIHDNGGEFIGHEFQELLRTLGIRSKPTTVKNPQANAIVERLHKTMADILRVMLHVSPPTNEADVNRMIDNALSTCMHASRCSVNHMMQTSPGAMVFNRDMLTNVPLMANLVAIRDRRQQLIDENIRRTNAKRIDHNYNIGDRVKMVEYDPTKLDGRTHGPYTIVRVFTNGTVRIQRSAHVQETVNIRKLFPYRGN